MLERSLAQLPSEAIGPGLLVRCDRAGATHAFLDHVAERALRFSVGLDLTEPVRDAILALPERAWQPAAASDGDEREGAWVAELDLDLELPAWPVGTRAICRRERPHPGAQLSFTDQSGYRFQVFLTNQQGKRIARLEQLHRARAACEDRIRCGKDAGLRNLPFRAFQANAAWLELVLMGQDLLCWTQRLLLADGELARCEPKRLRYGSCTSPPASPATHDASSCTCRAPGPGGASSYRRSSAYARCPRSSTTEATSGAGVSLPDLPSRSNARWRPRAQPQRPDAHSAQASSKEPCHPARRPY